ncbi:MAG: hypothetical protein HY536_00695 [Candidatus Colwellbacteria bacterium]|nr:hypothetical protein [Candidatus Colwellbacteria bacterium]
MKPIVVLYHDNCLDGFGAAWSAWKKFKSNATYRGVSYGFEPPEKLAGKEIYLLDFSFDEATLKRLERSARRLTVIDHHISAEKSVRSLANHVFNTRHSGAALAWRFFHPGRPLPRMLAHIEDVDLWRFKRARTREITTYLSAMDFNFTVWSKIARDLEDSKRRNDVVTRGKVALAYKNKLVEQLAQTADETVFEGFRAGVVNSPTLESEVGNSLVKKGFDIGIIWSKAKNRIHVSLRSSGDVDVAKIATRYGGGGHTSAAGFRVTELPWSTKL